jgi:hypothetical protein
MTLLSRNSTSAQVKELRPSLTSLPCEVVTMILMDIMTSLINAVAMDMFEDDYRPISVLRQYRSLVLTCKTFYQIIRDTRTEITIMGTDHGFLVWWGTEEDAPDEAEDGGQTHESFSELLKAWQIEALRRDLWIEGIDVKARVQQLGKFYANPVLTACDVKEIAVDEQINTWLLMLGQYFADRSREITLADNLKKRWKFKDQFQNYLNEIYTHDGYVSVVEDVIDPFMSVENWSYQDDEEVSGLNISVDVKEWWVIFSGERELYFAGYAGGNAWVFNAQSRRVYSNAGRWRRLGKRPSWDDSEDSEGGSEDESEDD